MPYLFQYSVELISANPTASFVNLESPINVIQLIFWLAIIIIVTAYVASSYSRFSIKWRVADRVEENFLSSGHPMMTGNRQAASKQSRPKFSRRSWPLYAFLMAIVVFGGMFWLDAGGQPGQDRRQLAGYSQEQSITTQAVGFVDKPRAVGQQFFNQAPVSPSRVQRSSVEAASNNSEFRSDDHPQEVQFASTAPEIRFVDQERTLTTFEDDRNEKGNGVTFTVQISVGSVEEFVQSNAKKIARLLPKERVYMYPEPGSSQIKTFLGVFTSQASAEAMLQRYRAASGSGKGFVTALPVEKAQLYIVPG